MKGGKPHGKGKMTWPDDEMYEGYWKNGMMHGTGKYTFYLDRSVYEGDFLHDKKNGKGKQTWDDGDIYEGDFKDDDMHGKGKYTYPNGNIYQGDFKHDKRHGKGKQIFTDGRTFNGHFINDEPDCSKPYKLTGNWFDKKWFCVEQKKQSTRNTSRKSSRQSRSVSPRINTTSSRRRSISTANKTRKNTESLAKTKKEMIEASYEIDERLVCPICKISEGIEGFINNSYDCPQCNFKVCIPCYNRLCNGNNKTCPNCRYDGYCQ